MKVRPFKATEVVSTAQAGDYTLAIDMEIVDAIEDAFDDRFDLVMEQFKNVRVGRLTRLVRVLLSRHHPDMTFDEVGALIMSYAEEIGKGIERLFEKASENQAGKANGENPPKPRRGTRKPS